MSRPSHQWESSGNIKRMAIEEEGTPTVNLPPIVDAMETERLVEALQMMSIEDVGSVKWMSQHRNLEKLNLQAHQNAKTNSEEYVLEAILTFDKIEFILHDLLVIEAWKESVYPLIVEEIATKNSMRLYFVLYHEATLINLLEIFMYYKQTCESAGKKMLDLVDYIGRKLARLNNTTYKFREQDFSRSTTGMEAKEIAEALQSRSPKEDLEQHFMEIEFRICVTAVSIARFLCEHADVMPLSVISRITDTHDLLILLVPLIENPPWTRRSNDGKWEKLIDHKWQVVNPIDLLKITKLEGQPWLGIYHLLAKSVFRERYHLNSFRKGQLLRVRKYVNDILLDQLPFLADIQRYMDELAVTDVPEPNSLEGNVFLFQQVAVLRDKIVKNKNWREVVEYQIEKVFTMTDKDDQDLLAMANLYSDDLAENILEDNIYNDAHTNES